MYCLDTSVIVEFLRGNKEVIKKMQETLDENEVFITPITLCELFQGAYLLKNAEDKVSIIKNTIEGFGLLTFSVDVSLEFGKEYARLRKLGKMIPEFDLVIGCFAKTNDLVLITRDKKHFENLNLKVEIW